MAALPILLVAAAALAQSSAEALRELEQPVEVEMALSAAPARLREAAGIYVLGKAGYFQVRKSANGFNCLVSREPNAGLGPICYDQEGSATSLYAELMRGRLLREGKTREAVDLAVAEAFRSGKLMAPRRAGVAYMLSTHFEQVSPRTGNVECVFPPHIMIYAPFARNSDIGAEKSRGSVHEPWILNEGKPEAVILAVDHAADVAACK